MAKGGRSGIPIMGHLGLGTVIKCDSTDNSYYCMFMKFMNFLISFIVLIGILYVVYTFFIQPMLNKGRGKKSA